MVTGAYAVLITGLKALNAPHEIIIGTCLYLTGIGLAQMIGGPRRARVASVLAGSILLPLSALALSVYARYSTRASDEFFAHEVCGGLVCAVVGGPLLGAMGGVLVAGVFLLMRYADALIHRAKQVEQDEKPEDDTVTR